MHDLKCLILGASLNVNEEKLARDPSTTSVKCSIKCYSAHGISFNCLQYGFKCLMAYFLPHYIDHVLNKTMQHLIKQTENVNIKINQGIKKHSFFLLFCMMSLQHILSFIIASSLLTITPTVILRLKEHLMHFDELLI